MFCSLITLASIFSNMKAGFTSSFAISASNVGESDCHPSRSALEGTWRGNVCRQLLITLQEHLRSSLVISEVRVVRSFVFYVAFCRALFLPFVFLFWPLYCLSFFDLQILIAFLVTSNFSWRNNAVLFV